MSLDDILLDRKPDEFSEELTWNQRKSQVSSCISDNLLVTNVHLEGDPFIQHKTICESVQCVTSAMEIGQNSRNSVQKSYLIIYSEKSNKAPHNSKRDKEMVFKGATIDLDQKRLDTISPSL